MATRARARKLVRAAPSSLTPLTTHPAKKLTTKPALDAGKGGLVRGTESGALLLDLRRHADVAQYAAWANSFGDQGVGCCVLALFVGLFWLFFRQTQPPRPSITP